MELRDRIVMIITCIFVPNFCYGKLPEIFASYYLKDFYYQQHFEQARWLRTTMLYLPDYPRNKTSSLVQPRSLLNMNTVPRFEYPVLKWLTSPVIDRNNVRNTPSTSLRQNPYTYENSLSKRHYVKHTDTTVELLLVVDYSIYRKYLLENMFDEQQTIKEIHNYLKILIAIVNERYQTIKDKTFSIHVQICDILIAKTKRDIAWFEYMARWSDSRKDHIVNASRALKRFHKWLRDNKSNLKYDHAVILTSYILSKRRRQVEGLAYVGTMCDTMKGKSASIVQDIGDFQSAGVIAHELGHSLNVTHDGEGASRNCPASRNYVMAPFNSHDAAVSTNVFYFSQCSEQQLKSFIRSPEARCLLNSPKEVFPHDLVNDPPGRMFNEDKQCELAFGAGSMFCEGGQFSSQICSKLWCTIPGEQNTCRTNNRLLALPGTPCGKMKFCNLGKCVSSYRKVLYNKIPLRDEVCPLDDIFPLCQSLITGSPYLCTYLPYGKLCCESCRARRT